MSLNQILRNDANPMGIYDVRLKTVECKELLAEALTIVNLTLTNLTVTNNIETKTLHATEDITTDTELKGAGLTVTGDVDCKDVNSSGQVTTTRFTIDTEAAGAATFDFYTGAPPNNELNAHITSSDSGTEIKTFRGNLDYSSTNHDFRNTDGKAGVVVNLNRITTELDSQPGTINFMKNSVTESSITGGEGLSFTTNSFYSSAPFIFPLSQGAAGTAVWNGISAWTLDCKDQLCFTFGSTLLFTGDQPHNAWDANTPLYMDVTHPDVKTYGKPMVGFAGVIKTDGTIGRPIIYCGYWESENTITRLIFYNAGANIPHSTTDLQFRFTFWLGAYLPPPPPPPP